MNIAGNVSRLITKSIGNTVEAGQKLQHGKLSIVVPQEAAVCDVFEGIGKKGQFTTYSFKDADGRAVQHYTRYIKDNGNVTDVVTDIDTKYQCFNLKRQTIDVGVMKNDGRLELNPTVQKVEHDSFIPQCNPSNPEEKIFTRSSMTETPEGDFGGAELLLKGEKPAGVSYKYNWDGSPVEFNYKNNKGVKLELTEEEQRYLPLASRQYIVLEQNGQPMLATMDFIPDRVQEKIGLIQTIQEKLHGIEGVLPKIKAVNSADDLHLVKTSGKTEKEWLAEKGFVPKAETLGDGQINVVVNDAISKDAVTLLDLLSHEMQHARDYIRMYQGGEAASNEALNRVGLTIENYTKANRAELENIKGNEFIEKVQKKLGIVQKGTPEYDEAVDIYEMNYRTTSAKNLKDIEQHDGMDIEKRAIEREYQQVNFFNRVTEKIGEFLGAILVK